MRINFLKVQSEKIPATSYEVNDRITIIPFEEIKGNTKDSNLIIASSGQINRNFLEDFGLYHAFITDEILILRELNNLSSSVETQNYKKREDYIKEREAHLGGRDPNFHNYDSISPIHKLSLEISYREGYHRYSKEKANKTKLYQGIQLYVFSRGFDTWQRFYHNLNLKDALNYSILDSLCGHPSHCKGEPHCNCCSKEIPHQTQSRTSYTRDRLEERLCNLDEKERGQYIELFNKIVGVRGGTYHEAIYYDVLREMVREIKTFDNNKWTLEHTIKNFKTAMGRNVANIRFSNLIKYVLINELFNQNE